MSDIPPSYNDEIDLLRLIETLWNGKWKILISMIIPFAVLFGFNTFFLNKKFNASTEIKPITSSENDKYTLYNSYIISLNDLDVRLNNLDYIPNLFQGNKFFKITPKLLLDLYLEKITEGNLFETGIKKFELINKKKYVKKQDYDDAVVKLASDITLLIPPKSSVKSQIQKKNYHTLNFNFDDQNKWNEVLFYVNTKINRAVQKTINDRFYSIFNSSTQLQKFSIEDINNQIESLLQEYELKTQSKLAFLKEQAKIARKLNVKKSTIETQFFTSQNSVITNVKTDAPFYLRGYDAIEEEINQINSRKNKKNFVPEIPKLEYQKMNLERSKIFERAEKLFLLTPVAGDDFKSVLFKVASTKYEMNHNTKFYYLLSIIFGSIIGVFYVLISTAFKNR